MRALGLRSSLLGIVLAAVAATGVAASAEPIIQTVEEHRNDIGEIEKRGGDFIHRSAGFVFPSALGAMPARKTYTYGPGDAEVYYTLYGGANGDSWLSLYVYPAGTDIAQHSKEVAAPILERFKANPIAAPTSLPPGPEGAIDGWYEGTIEGEQVITGYRLMQSGRWFIKARVTIPLRGGDPALKRAMDAIGAIQWTWHETRSRSTPQPAVSNAA